MLAYADNSRPVASLTGSPRAMMLIIAGHAVLLAAVMTAKMEVVVPGIEHVPTIFNVDPPPPPPPPEPQPRPAPRTAQAQSTPQQTFIDNPLGHADSTFLEAARRHIIRAWRYKPATEDGVAVSSTMVISLSFRLEDA